MTKDIYDYLDKMYEKHPYIPKQDLERIMLYGFFKYYRFIRRGCDVTICDHRYHAYSGKMWLNDYLRCMYNNNKAHIKQKMLYTYHGEEFEGYYYFGLNEEQFQEWKNSQKRGNRVCKFKFKDIKLYKNRKESYINYKLKHFFRYTFPVDVGWMFHKDTLLTDQVEYFAVRNTKDNKVTEFK